jgi:hypothetical protein
MVRLQFRGASCEALCALSCVSGFLSLTLLCGARAALLLVFCRTPSALPVAVSAEQRVAKSEASGRCRHADAFFLES